MKTHKVRNTLLLMIVRYLLTINTKIQIKVVIVYLIVHVPCDNIINFFSFLK